MATSNSVINLDIGLNAYSEEFYFLYSEKNEIFDPVYIQGLLFTNFILKAYLEIEGSVHSKTFAEFLKGIKQEDIEILVNEKNDFPDFNPEENSPDDIHFYLELIYSEKEHLFAFEAQGSWHDQDLYKFDIVNSVISLISYLGKKNIHNVAYLDFLTEIANYTGEYFKKYIITEDKIQNISFMIVTIAYENFLKETTIV